MLYTYLTKDRMRVAPEIVLTKDERLELVELTTSGLTSVRLAQRAHIVLLAADGLQNQQMGHRPDSGGALAWALCPVATCRDRA